MSRLGTLLGTDGRPEDRVQIIRKNKKTTRITRAVDHGRSWAPTDEVVDTDRILDDGGTLWEQHSRNPKHATLLSTFGEPTARLKVQRVYATVVKARLYRGGNRWGEVEDFPPKNVRFDGGASWGWNPPAFDQPATGADDAPATTATGQETTTDSRGQRVSYIRVSSVDQNLARQREAIGSVDREFRDEISARSRDNRPGLDNCIDYLRHGDTLCVASIDRLARSLVDLRTIIDQITDKGASVHFVKEHLHHRSQENDHRDERKIAHPHQPQTRGTTHAQQQHRRREPAQAQEDHHQGPGGESLR